MNLANRLEELKENKDLRILRNEMFKHISSVHISNINGKSERYGDEEFAGMAEKIRTLVNTEDDDDIDVPTEINKIIDEIYVKALEIDPKITNPRFTLVSDNVKDLKENAQKISQKIADMYEEARLQYGRNDSLVKQIDEVVNRGNLEKGGNISNLKYTIGGL
jgi:hypothetical protein